MIWAAVFLSAAVAGLIQSVTGFGAAVMMMLVVPYFFDMIRAPALVSTVALGLSVVLAWRFRRYVEWKLTLPVAAVYILFSTAAISLLGSLDLNGLTIAFAVFLILLSLYYQFFAKSVAIRPTIASALVCGAVAGVCGGLFSIGGPISALYFLPAAKSKEHYIANLQMLFAITNSVNLVVRAVRGIYTLDLVPLTVLGILGVNLGKIAGLRVLDRLDIDKMKQIVYIFIGVSGVLTLVSHL